MILRPEIVIVSYMCNSLLRGYQTLLCDWMVIKVDFGFTMKYAEEYERSRWNLPLLYNRRDISGPLDVDGLRKCMAMPNVVEESITTE